MAFHAWISWSNLTAFWNMPVMSSTLDVSQLLRGRLNDDAPENMDFMSSTSPVSQSFSGWSKLEAPLNIVAMDFTLPVFQMPIFPLNAAAARNVCSIVSTAAVFHVPMFWLKSPHNAKVFFKSVTLCVSQPLTSWLNAAQKLNMLSMVVTFDVSQLLSGLALLFPGSPLLKTMAPSNRDAMVVTALVSHVDRSGLNVADTRLIPPLSAAKYDKSVIPVVQDVDSSASVPASPRSASRPALSLLV